MKINVQSESAITLAEVPQYIPKRAGKKVHYSTVYRWATKGVRGHVLESIMVGGIRYTSIEAVQRFLAARSQRHRWNEHANSKLDAAIDELLRREGV